MGSAVVWSGVETLGAAGLALVSAFVVARVVGPAAVGVGAVVVAVHVLVWVGVNALFADAVVREVGLGEREVSGAFWASVGVGCAAAVVQGGLGWVLWWVVGDGRLVAMAWVLAVPLPLVGAGGVVQGRLVRARRYRLLAARPLVGQGLGTAVGVWAALHGAGAWALVAQQAVTSGSGALVLLVGAGWWPGWGWDGRAVRRLLRVGVPLTVSTLVLHGRYRVFLLLVGATAGPATLGVVHLAFRLGDSVREMVSSALWRLVLPVVSARQADLPGVRAAMERALAVSGLVVFPLCGAVFLAIGPAVGLLLGPAWAAAGWAALPLAAWAAWLFLGFPAGAAMVAVGAPGVALRAQVAGLALLVVGVLVLRPAGPLAAVGVWLAAQAATAPYVLGRSARRLGVPVWGLLRAGVAPLGLAVAGTALAWVVPGVLSGALPGALPGAGPGPALLLAERGLVAVAAMGPGLLWLAARQRGRGFLRDEAGQLMSGH